MDGINSSLSEPDKLDYDDSIKLVQKAVEELAIARIKNRNQPLSIDAAVRILNDVSAAYGVKNGLFKSLVPLVTDLFHLALLLQLSSMLSKLSFILKAE